MGAGTDKVKVGPGAVVAAQIAAHIGHTGRFGGGAASVDEPVSNRTASDCGGVPSDMLTQTPSERAPSTSK